MRWLKKTAESLIYSNIFIGICAVALAFTNQLTIGAEIRFDHNCWFILASTIFTYSYLKVTAAGNAAYTTRHRNWAAEHEQVSRNILLISMLATITFFFLLEKNVKMIVIALAAVTAFYGFVKMPFTNPGIKLRDLGLLKTIFVAIVWSVTTVVVPLAGDGIGTDMMVFLLLRRFLFIVALTMLFEIKDLDNDIANGLKTLPVAIGITGTKLLAQLILTVLMLIVVVQYLFYDVPLANVIAVNISLLISIFCIQPISKNTGDSWFYFVLDGMMLLQFILVYTAANLLA